MDDAEVSSKVLANLPLFIKDVAASEDSFGTHSYVAKAIASVIRSKQQIRILGLLGAWGSGKSTVLSLIEKEFSTRDETEIETHIFIYDAWLHQSDPPRRSFLETLIQFLDSRGLTTAAKWQLELDRLNRRAEDHEIRTTPTLTGAGKLIGATLLLFPLGVQLIGKDWWGKFLIGTDTVPVAWLGISFLISPIIAAVVVYASWRPTLNIFSGDFWNRTNWNRHRPPHDDSSIFSIFVNKSVDRVRNRIIKTPDPTAIEFHETFRRLMTSVATPMRRFLFVIDNLDRIPETEAITMWSTVRSFFLDPIGGFEPNPIDHRVPYVLLPLDPGSIHRMYAVSHAESEVADLAKSFLDKTFDLTFRLGPPVLSDWQDYLAKKLREVFSDRATEDRIYAITKLYENFLAELQRQKKQNRGDLTPRMINTLINSLAVLELQWGSKIAFATLAYYAIHKERIEENIQGILAEDVREIEQFDSDWARGIAAIYYGVPIERALQVMIQPQVRTAIESLELSEFTRLSKVKGFSSVLEKIVKTECSDVPKPEFLVNTSLLISESELPTSVWLEQVRKRLRAEMSRCSNWKNFTDSTPRALTTLLVGARENEREAVYRSVVGSLARVESEFVSSASGFETWSAAAVAAFKFAEEHRLAPQNINVPGGVAFFLNVMMKVASNATLIKALRSNENGQVVINGFTAFATQEKFGEKTRTILTALIKSGQQWQWSEFIEAANKLIREQAVDDIAIPGALEALGVLRHELPGSGAQERLKALSDEGFLFDRLYQAHQSKMLSAEAATLAVTLLVNPALALNGRVGNAPQGHGLIQNPLQMIADRPDVLQRVDEYFGKFGDFKELVDASIKNANVSVFIRRIFSLRVEKDDIGPLHVSDVLARLPNYLSLVEDAQKETFLHELARYETFWKQLSGARLSANAVQIANSLLGLHDERGDLARQHVVTCCATLTNDDWFTALRDNSEPAPIALSAINHDGPAVDFGEPLLQAICRVFIEVLDGGMPPNAELLCRCLLFLRALSLNAQQTFYKNVRDKLLTPAKDQHALPVFRACGAALISEGEFNKRADQAVRFVLLPLLDGREGGIAWLNENREAVAEWIAGADEGTRGYLGERLSVLKGSEAGMQHVLVSLITSWHMESYVKANKAEAEAVDKAVVSNENKSAG